jgi:hypothetical protein
MLAGNGQGRNIRRIIAANGRRRVSLGLISDVLSQVAGQSLHSSVAHSLAPQASVQFENKDGEPIQSLESLNVFFDDLALGRRVQKRTCLEP